MPTHREESARRIVIAEEFIGDMLPLTQQEMDRQVHLRDGAHVRGGVYGGDVFIEGNVTVDGPICSRTSVRFAPGPDAKITVNGGVKATHSVVVEGSGPDPQVLIRGDVYAKQANLRGTRILGNLFSGGRVGLEDSIVIGFVFTRGDLFAARSSMVSFRARSAALGDGVGLWLPAAFAEEKLELAGPVRCGLLSLNDQCEHGDSPSAMGLHCPKFQEGACTGCTTFEANDLHDSRIKAVPLVGDATPHGYLVLSLVPRIMDLSQLPQAKDATLRLLETLKEDFE